MFLTLGHGVNGAMWGPDTGTWREWCNMGLLHSWPFPNERKAPARFGCSMAWGKAWAWRL